MARVSHSQAIRIATAAALALFVTWEALSPTRDWRAAPIYLFPLRFQMRAGAMGIDTAMHVVGTTAIILLMHWLLGLPSTTRGSVKLVGGVLSWLSLLELTQGLLPYRTLQLTDLLANLTGATLAFGIMAAFRGTRTRSQVP